ncbi:DUF1648 domain-containing protein [Agromyces italicus]|uniref:DUF1648 domain-containing protein n=1 Tax=Agromyces italicus TaxID=279572 RepID=UPI0003B3D87F|nr:DUF1648 domain-containing protein [Agromyces italicus]
MTRSDEFRTARRRFLLVAALAPVLVTIVGVALMLAWLPEVPSTIATHWSGGGAPDGFAPAWTAPLGAALLGLGLTALFVGIMFGGTRDGRWGPMMRLLGAFSLGTTVLLVVLLTWSLGMQRGLDDPAEAPGIGVPLLVSAGLAVLSGVVAWFAQPRTTLAGPHASESVAPLELNPNERAVWVRTTTMSRAAMIAIGAGVAGLAIGSIVAAAVGSPAWWILLATSLLLAALAATTFVFRVRVDERGLEVRSSIGAPWFRVPLAQMRQVSVTDVNPTAEFGGWGIRLAPDGAFGVVLRSGEALQLVRENGRRFVVTVDDAATAAALLEALSARAREARH